MASTREERLQMRQRGAGTREIKRVDFGFSFGGPAIGQSEPAPISNAAEPVVPPSTQPAPTSTPQASQTSSQRNSQNNEGTRNTSGSARNKLPQRPSTYDIPSDDGPGEPRSNKRRRINPPQPDLESLPRSNAATSPNNDSAIVPNGHSHDPEAPANRASEATATDAPQATAAYPSRQAQLSSAQPSPSKKAEANGAEGVGSTRSEEQARSGTQVPRATVPDTEDTSSMRTRSPNASRRGQSTEVTRKKQRKDSPTRQIEPTEQDDDHSTRMSTSPKTQRSTEAKAKGVRKGRNAVDSPEPNKEPTAEIAEPSQSQTAENVATEIENQTRSEHGSANSNAASKPKRARGRPSLASKAAEAREKGRSDAPEPTSTAGESSATGARRGRKKKADTRPEPEPEAEPEETQEPEPAPEQGAKATAPKPRRGRPAKKTRQTTERQPSPTEEQRESPPVQEADAETARQAQRKPREPRGETVPVTVHRLTNASALGAMYADADGSGDEEEESADELSSRQKTKLPNRGGVNPADVLGQICRETLEKTLTTLKNGIANETNPTRRAEWTRKRKAVEAFSSELDGRLLDLSEMLDSNFVLGVQLKKAKREMMDLRSHLYQVRRERESIALQMDVVRAKHMEEENAKTARANINNSLHSLELALDRSQRAPSSTEPSSADLEFMLRTVADDVSSRAPGSQGGLLQQIRTFNAQLESTARRLEGK